jgi:hypothetical protein
VADCFSCLLAKKLNYEGPYLSALVVETLHLKLKFLRNTKHILWSFGECEKEIGG